MIGDQPSIIAVALAAMPSSAPQWLAAALEGAASDPAMLMILLALTTLITEDGALLIGSLLVGSEIITAPLAITALTAGILIGDIALYAFGWSARKLRFLLKYLPLKKIGRLKYYLKDRKTGFLFMTRFLPGTRFVSYTGYGFLRLPFLPFVSTLAIAGCLWVVLMVLFISEVQGFARALGPWGSLILAAGIGIAFLVAVPKLVTLFRVKNKAGAVK